MNTLWKAPESALFRQPVDVETLRVPNYIDSAINGPLDLDTVRAKLETSLYADPWEFIDDVWRMLDNTRLIYDKQIQKYKDGVKLAEIFKKQANETMSRLGFCCGETHVFNPKMWCTGGSGCLIERDDIFYNSDDSQETLCARCFDDSRYSQSKRIFQRPSYRKRKNSAPVIDDLVTCNDCNRKFHKICVLYLEEMWTEGFKCKECVMANGLRRTKNIFNAKGLPSCKLSDHIENRLKIFLEERNCNAGEVIIRVLHAGNTEIKVGPEMTMLHPNSPKEYPAKSKVIYGFQSIEGNDICFFAMFVQEYDSECPEPNARRVNISYLDSLPFFEPTQHKTGVYQTILIGYMDYVRSLGYLWAHLWACPSTKDNEFVFFSHPPSQKFPDHERLQQWYRTMLDQAVQANVVVEYKTLQEYWKDNSLKSLTQLAYFKDDFWPEKLEEIIATEKKNEQRYQECRARRTSQFLQREPYSSEGGSNKVGQNRTKFTKSSVGERVLQKTQAAVQALGEAFFIIQLRSAMENPPPIVDPDSAFGYGFFSSRQDFFDECRNKRWQFSSRQLAAYSTMQLLLELHVPSNCVCNICSQKIRRERFHCSECYDFDLCSRCYSQHGHAHLMTRLGAASSNEACAAQSNPTTDPMRSGSRNCNSSSSNSTGNCSSSCSSTGNCHSSSSGSSSNINSSGSSTDNCSNKSSSSITGNCGSSGGISCRRASFQSDTAIYCREKTRLTALYNEMSAAKSCENLWHFSRYRNAECLSPHTGKIYKAVDRNHSCQAQIEEAKRSTDKEPSTVEPTNKISWPLLSLDVFKLRQKRHRDEEVFQDEQSKRARQN